MKIGGLERTVAILAHSVRRPTHFSSRGTMAEAAPAALAAMEAPAAGTGVPTVAKVPGNQRSIDGSDLVPVVMEVSPPVGVQRMPCDICVVIDTSGSI